VKIRPRGHADLYRALIDQQLTVGSHEQEVRAEIYSSQVTETEVSPRLEMTRWPRYFHGLNMADVAPLAYAAIDDSRMNLPSSAMNIKFQPRPGETSVPTPHPNLIV
jgi:hypothetical protein